LLDDVGQFVCQQFLPGVGFRHILAGSAYDILPCGVSLRMRHPRRASSLCIGVYAYAAKVVAKARLKEAALRLGQRPAATLQRTDLGCQAGTYSGSFPTRLLCLDGLPFLFFLFLLRLLLLALHPRAVSHFCSNGLFLLFLIRLLDLPLHQGRDLASQWFGSQCLLLVLFLWHCLALQVWLRHAHHLVGDAVCLPLVFVVRLADGEFGLDQGRPHGEWFPSG
jgi:hypothetical protein